MSCTSFLRHWIRAWGLIKKGVLNLDSISLSSRFAFEIIYDIYGKPTGGYWGKEFSQIFEGLASMFNKCQKPSLFEWSKVYLSC